MAVDEVQDSMGQFGRYHFFLCFIIFLNKIPIAFHQMAIIFLAPKVSYDCPDSPGPPPVCPCPNPVYNTSVFSSTIVMDYNLICDRRWLASLTQMLFQLGTLLGSIFFGMASDRYGRRRPLLFAIVLQLSAGVGAAYAKTFTIFTFLRFLVGISVGGTMVIGFVIIMEFVGAKHREWLSAVYQIPFNIGHLLLPVISYYTRTVSSFQLVISLYGCILIPYFCLLPETARWLLAMKRTEEAVVLIEKVAKINKKPTANIRSRVEAYQAAITRSNLKKGTVFDLFRTPNMRKHIILMSLDWLNCSYCFYGVSQYVGQLSGNIFRNVAAGAAIVMMGSVASIPMMKIMGRRTIVILCNFTCASCLFLLALLPKGIVSVVLATVGQVTSFIVFVVVYLYGSEMFPTVVRNAAIGFSSMMARVGSMIAPFVLDLEVFGTWLPPAVFAIAPLICGILTFFLPETKGVPIMTTIEEGERLGQDPVPETGIFSNFPFTLCK